MGQASVNLTAIKLPLFVRILPFLTTRRKIGRIERTSGETTLKQTNLLKVLGILPLLLGGCGILLTNIIVLQGLPLYSQVEETKSPPPDAEIDETTLIVLGAGVRRQELSGMLKCRMHKAIDLYARQRATKILLSGDGTDPHYNETAAMKKYALQNGLPKEKLLSDPLGYSTYDSLRRAIEVFGIRAGVIVSQDFHLKRALWLAESFGMKAQGSSCDNGSSSQFYDLREIPARTKDVILRWFDFAPRSNRDELF